MRRYLNLIFILSFILAVPIHATLEQTTPVYACSGGGGTPNILSLLEDSDIVVQAQIIDSDDIRGNAIIKVSSYVVGDAVSEYLAIKQAVHRKHHAYEIGVDPNANGCW